MMQIKAFLGSRPMVDAAVSGFLLQHPQWWVADTRDWKRPGQLVAPPESLLLRLGSIKQIEREIGPVPGVVIAAVPVGPIDSETWRQQLNKLSADVADLSKTTLF